jgi:aminoglycoside phosphotransferase (APT) family kinase protein
VRALGTVNRRQLRARPPADALAWAGAALGGVVTRVRALGGGRSSAVHALRVTRSGRPPDTVVLRRYVRDRVLEEDPDIVQHEAGVLDQLRDSPLPVPRLLAVDTSGDDAGVPALLMSHLPGRPDWSPRDVDPWLRGLAGFLVGLHDVAVPSGAGLGPFQPYPPERREPPPWMRHAALWDRAVEVSRSQPGAGERVLIHRDYHPGNVLWRAGKVTGVVDWQEACVGPPSVDVAWCRLMVLGRLGIDAADRLVSYWEGASGRAYHPWAEVAMLVERLSWPTVPKARVRTDLEATLDRRLAELRA